MQQYSEIIKFHYHHPLNTGKLANATHTAEQLNPLCGDETKIYLRIEPCVENSRGRGNFPHSNFIINDVRHETRGCMISIAAASVLSEFIKGQTLSEIKKITKEDIDKLLGVKISKARASCATLALTAIQKL